MAIVKWSPFRRIEQILTHYLESGFLELGSTAKCAEATFLPAKLWFYTGILSYLGTSPTPLEGGANLDELNQQVDSPFYGEALINGQPARSCGGQSLVVEVRDPCGNTYLSETPYYGSQGMWLRKATQRYVPSSYFSGKLKLFVQAVYGSTRTDYEVPLGETGLPDTSQSLMYLDDFPITSQIPTSGLFTDIDYNYWLMRVEVSQITFYPLVLTTTAQQWRDFFKTHPNKADKFFAARVEAYILAYATIDQENKVIIPTGASTPGGPMGFGFKFNWSGNEASIVLHELDGQTGYNYSRTLTLSIHNDLTVTSSETPPQLWVNGPSSQYWAPNHYEYWLENFGKTLGGDTNQSNVPMYGYYIEDIWTPVTVSCSVQAQQTVNDPFDFRITQDNLPGWGYDSPVGANKAARSGTNVLIGGIGYTFGSESAYVPKTGSHTYRWRRDCYIRDQPQTFTGPIFNTFFSNYPPLTKEHGNLGDHMVSSYPYAPGVKGYGWYLHYPTGFPRWQVSWGYGPDGFGPDANSEWKAMTFETSNTNIEFADCGQMAGYTEGGTVMLAVPLDDCEAIIFGSYAHSGWTSKVSFSYTSESALSRGPQSQILNMRGFTGGTSVVVGVLETCNNKQELYGGNIFNSGTHNVVTTGAGGASTTTIKYSHSGMGLWSHQETSGYVLKTASDNVQDLPVWATQYFLPGDITGPYRPVISGKTSLGGANILFHSLNELGYSENGYPYGVFSAVGYS